MLSLSLEVLAILSGGQSDKRLKVEMNLMGFLFFSWNRNLVLFEVL